MNEPLVREWKVRYVAQLVAILGKISAAGEGTEEHLEAVRQVEWALLNCLNPVARPLSSWSSALGGGQDPGEAGFKPGCSG